MRNRDALEVHAVQLLHWNMSIYQLLQLALLPKHKLKAKPCLCVHG